MKNIYYLFYGIWVYGSYYFSGLLLLPFAFYDWIKDQCKKDGTRICKMCHKYIRKRDRSEIQMHKECWHKMLNEVFCGVVDGLKKAIINLAYAFRLAAPAILEFSKSMEKLKEDPPGWK